MIRKNEMLKTVISAVIIMTSVSAFSQSLPLISERAKTNYIVMFNGTQEISQVHKTISEHAGHRKVEIVNPLSYKFPVTNWAQDRLVRTTNGVGSSMSAHIIDSNISPYELAVPKYLPNTFPTINTKSIWLSRPTRQGDVSIVNSEQKNWLPASTLEYALEDGGDRIVGDNWVMWGTSSFNKVLRNNRLTIDQLEIIIGKKIILIDSEIEYERYAFHIDLFITYINDKTVLLGSVTAAKAAGHISKNYETLLIYENKIRDQLKQNNITVIDIPLIKTDDGWISYNNGIFIDNTFFLSNYTDSTLDVGKIQLAVKSVFNSLNISTIFINGGGSRMKLGGQVRCAVALF